MSTNSVSGVIAASDQTLAGYTLVERLGSGGYGEVWRAAAPGGLTKAVKIVYGNFTDARGTRELKALDRIKDVRHPFLLSLERIEVVDNRLVIVTELADMSLKDRFDQCRAAGLPGIPRKELMANLRDAADALDFMHDRYSLQHMDVKPENLLIVGGRLKVADFGLVKDLHEVSVSVLDGMTPPYAPPELFNGTPSERSDQYSLAVVYQEMLTGELPFTARTSAEWARIHIAAARKPNLEPLPVTDRRTVDRALARLPIDRFGNCSEFVDALCGQTPPASSPSLPQPPKRAGTQRTPPPACSEYDRTLQIADFLATVPDTIESTQLDTATNAQMPSNGSGSCTIHARKQPIEKLPPLAFDPQQWQPRPTLVIGIGGTGARIVGQLRRRLSEKFGRSANYPAWSAMLVDIDEEALERAVDQEGTVLEADTIPTPLRSTRDYRDESVDLLKWISRRWLYNIPHTRQTQGWRPLGRLAFADHGQRFRQRVQERLAEMLTPAALNQSSGCVGREFAATPRIVLVASICGGTGSGMALDAGYALRQALEEAGIPRADVISLLTVSANRDNSQRDQAWANAYACLQEFDYYSTSPLGFPGDPWCGMLPRSAGIGPFDHTYLVHLGQSLDEERYATQCDLTAEYLFFDQATPIGRMLDGCREEPAPAGSLRSFRLVPLTFTESELQATIEHRLQEELARLWCSHDRSFPTGSALQERVRHIPDAARQAAADRVRRVLGGVVRCEFVELANYLVAQAQTEGSAGSSSIAAALEGIVQQIQLWQAAPRVAPTLLPKDETYGNALRAAFEDRLKTLIPALAGKVSNSVVGWAMQSLGPGRTGAPPCLDVLGTLPARAAALIQTEVRRVLADIQVASWILPALGDARHAILCWREFLTQSEPVPLAAGGQRRLALIAPDSPANSILCEMLQTAFGEPTSAVANLSPVVWLMQEAQQIGALDVANHLFGQFELVKEAASRLHTRIDRRPAPLTRIQRSDGRGGWMGQDQAAARR